MWLSWTLENFLSRQLAITATSPLHHLKPFQHYGLTPGTWEVYLWFHLPSFFWESYLMPRALFKPLSAIMPLWRLPEFSHIAPWTSPSWLALNSLIPWCWSVVASMSSSSVIVTLLPSLVVQWVNGSMTMANTVSRSCLYRDFTFILALVALIMYNDLSKQAMAYH